MTAQTSLVLGANTFIAQANCSISFSTTDPFKFGQQLGLLWLPLDEQRINLPAVGLDNASFVKFNL